MRGLNMRILLISRFYRNGQTTHILTLCETLKQQGHDVLLIMSRLNCTFYQSWLTSKGIRFYTHGDPLRLINSLRLWGPQIIHNHSAHTLAAALSLGDHLNAPVVTTVHYHEFIPQLLLCKQGAVIVISKEMLKAFRMRQSPVFFLENCVPIPPKPVCDKTRGKSALFLARVSKEKNENFRLMSQKLLDWGWEVESAGTWRFPGLKHWGWQVEVWPLLERATLVIGTGMAIREAMAAGCAAWVLGDYCGGLVTPCKIEAMRSANFSGRHAKKPFSAAAARLFLEHPDPEMLEALGSFGRNYALRHFSLQQMVRKLVKIYEYVLV